MLSTKRKFHNLLNSITNNSSSTSFTSVQATNASTTALPENQAKKRRITRPLSGLISTRSQPRSSNDRQTTRRNEDHPETTQMAHNAEGTQSPPNYAPWDRAQFLGRLKTFRHVDKWSPKPTKVNEVEWAKRGWSCVGKERVGCLGGCGREVYIKLEDRSDISGEADDGLESWSVGAEESLIDRYAEMIIIEHDDECLWRKRGCDNTIYRLPLNNPSTSTAALKARYVSLVAMESEIPSNVLAPDDNGIQDVVKTLPEDFLHSPQNEKDGSTSLNRLDYLNKDALLLAMLGWQAETGHIKGLVTCEACFRRLGLWLFQSRQQDASLDRSSSEEVAATMNTLDVINEHREFCPWINAASQNGSSGGEPGWKILVRVLSTAHSFNSRSTVTTGVSDVQAQPQADAMNESESITSDPPGEEKGVRDLKDKERWAKLKKLAKAFDVRRDRKVAKLAQH